MTAELLEVAVIGVGRMGRHHARTYRKVTGAKLVAVVDPDEERAATVADESGCEYFTSVAALLEKHPHVRAVTVAVPTVRHLAAARPLLERGIACLIEKPLAPTPEESRQLVELAARHHAPLQVGHTERFNPAVSAVMAMNLRPRFLEVHRISPMTFRSLDIGVVMDMMIHDLDIVLTLAQSPLARLEAAGFGVIGEHEDIANARLMFENGCVANVTASRLALKTERKLRVFSPEAYVSLDYQQRTGTVLHREGNVQALEQVRQQLEAGADLSTMDYSKLVKVEHLAMGNEQDPLTAELTSFVAAVREKKPPVVDGPAGLAAVELAQRIVATIASQPQPKIS